jgi:hypothetical protein
MGSGRESDPSPENSAWNQENVDLYIDSAICIHGVVLK